MMQRQIILCKLIKSTIPIILALALGYLIILISGYDANDAYFQLVKGSLGSSRQIMNTLFATTPILLTSLATLISFRAGLYNMGSEGQLYLGGFAAAFIGFTVDGLPMCLHVIACLITGMIVGMGYSMISGVLKAYLNVDEMVSTLMMNYIALLLTTWLASYPFRAPGSSNPQTVKIQETAVIPRIINGSQLHYGFFIALLVLFIVLIIFRNSKLGYNIDSIGKNPFFSKFIGINVKKNIVIIMGLSGILSGLAGALEILGTHKKFVSGFGANYGWTGLTVALLGRLNPLGALFGSLIFGILKTGGSTMEIITGVPRSLISILEGLIVLFITVDTLNKKFSVLNNIKNKLLKGVVKYE
ncbi:ABC transporter permease [Tuanshanicoccus lijuaniae]|uniref:ABC transporter permease n=1 Tax=Aerococcaceae bacterium zg-1292 TaxID=2774330 RepID=UPI001934F649|nr:ABC transporter permease [Aerococcaceae bacterium zg-1292]QQA36613.1 ABC transporter permease [Aerococcaceae bacterium zg-1292]